MPGAYVLFLLVHITPFLNFAITLPAFSKPLVWLGFQSCSLASPQDTGRTSNCSGQLHIHEMLSKFLLSIVHSRWPVFKMGPR